MTKWHLHAVKPSLKVMVTCEMPNLAASLDADVSEIWDMEQTRLGGVLFNGRVFSADTITPNLVTGHWTEYRRIVAQLRRPELHAGLGIRPLAVGGIILGPDGLIFGRRQPQAVYQAGEWQLPPAGNVDRTCERPNGEVDVVAMLLTELEEELGISQSQVHSPRPMAIVEHTEVHILDLGIALNTDLPAHAILVAHRGSGNAEYDPIAIISQADLPSFLAQDNVTGQAPLFLKTLGLFSN
jgi:hypothetical protein